MTRSSRFFTSLLRMKRGNGTKSLLTSLLAFLLIFEAAFPVIALASGPSSNRIINYQLRLADSGGTPVADGSYNLKLTVYDAASGGTQLYTFCATTDSPTGTPESLPVTFVDGSASILIGDTTITCNSSGFEQVIPATLFNGTTLYLGVTVAADAEMTPRKRIVSAGYALNADRLDDLETSSTGGTSAFVPVADSSGNLTLTGNPTGSAAVITANPAAAQISTNDQLLSLKNDGTAKFTVDAEGDTNLSGDITGTIVTLDGTDLANGTGSTATTLILDDTTGFNAGNYIQLASTNCVTSVNTCYAKIVSVDSGTNLTISPALTWADNSVITEIRIAELGGSNTASTLANRFGRGYFIDGIVTGNGSTRFTDNLIDTTAGTLSFNTANNRPVTFGSGTVTAGGNMVVTGTITSNSTSNSTIGGALDVNGATVTIDQDNAGAGANARIIANQGSDLDGEIRYNATTNQWEISNNGGAFAAINTGFGTSTLQNTYDNDADGSGATITTNATDGALIIAGDQAFNVTTSGATTVSNAFTVNGNTTFGNAFTDRTTINGEFVLGSDANDPTGVNGLMYYNTTSNEFRCFQNSTWKSCDLSSGGYSGQGVSGQVTFWTGTNSYTGDTSFVWDNTNKRLGVGDASPAALFTVGTSDAFQVNASGNTSTTGTLTVDGNTTLGNATTDQLTINGRTVLGSITADPSGSNGMMYYNSTDNKFRCFEASAWKDCDTTTGGLSGSGAAGQAVFWTSGTGLSGDNGFYWDDTNKRLSIGGDVTPADVLSVGTTSQLTINSGGSLTTSGSITTTSNLQVDGNTTLGNGTTDQLTINGRTVLGNITGTDPSGSEGMMYYNSTDDKFRCFENSTWKDCDTGGAGGYTGSGSSGQVTFWTGASAFGGDTNLFWDNTNKRLGIGEASPTQAFVVGAGNDFTVTSTGVVSTTGSITTTSTLQVDGNTTLGNAVTDRLTVNGELKVGSIANGAGNGGGNDPTGSNGLMYYNTTNDKFRCYEAGVWKDCDTGGAGGYTGSGTDGQATFWTGGSSFGGDNSFFWDNTNKYLSIGGDVTPANVLSVGTTSQFTVSSTGSIATSGTLSVTSTSGSLIAGAVSFTSTGTSSFNGNLTVDGNTTFGNASTDRTTINGELKIGSVSADPAGTNGLMYYNTTSQKFRCYENSNWKDCDTTSGGLSGAGIAGTLTYWSNTATLAYDASLAWDDTNDRLGIGDATPDADIDVETASVTTTGLFLNNTSTGDPAVAFQLAGTSTFTIGVDNSDSDKFKISTTALGTGDRVVIDSSGNVGIGDSTPDAKLDVDGGNIRLDSGVGATASPSVGRIVFDNQYDNSGNATANKIMLYDTGTEAFGIGVSASDLDMYSAGNFRFYVDHANETTQGTEAFTILEGTGNVGIGDATPSALLSVGSGDLFTVSSTGNVTITRRLDLADHAANVGLNIPTNAGVPVDVTGSANGDLVFNSSTDTLYVRDGGVWAAVAGGGAVGPDSLDFVDFEDTLDLDAALVMNQTTNTWTQNFTGTTTTGLTYNANSVTTGRGVQLNATAITTGTALEVLATNQNGSQANGLVHFEFTNSDTSTNAQPGALAIDYNFNGLASEVVDRAARITNKLTASTSTNDVNALLYLENLDTAASGSTEVANAIEIAAATDGFIIDAVDASDAEITNALNAGSNFIILGTNQLFGSTTTTTFEDSAGNDLLTIFDNGTTGNVVVTGRFDMPAHAANIGLNIPTNAGVPSAVTGTAEGDIVWDSTNDAIYVYNGSAFVAGGISVDSLDFTDFQDTLDLDAALVMNQTTNTWTQNFTGTTTNGLTYNANSVTTGRGVQLNATAITTGTALEVLATNQNGSQANGLVHFEFTNSDTSTNAQPGALAIDYNFNGLASEVVDRAARITNKLTASTSTNDVNALLYLENLDTAASGSTEVANAIEIAALTDGFIIDAVDGSDAEITNALNIGQNFLVMGADNGAASTMRFGSTATVMTFEDSSGNDLLTITDNGTTGNVAVTGRFASANHAANQGLKLPTNAGVPSAVTGTAEGDIVWDSTNDAIYVYNGSAFVAGGISVDSLDFTEFQDTLDLDAALTLNQTTNTWSQTFTGTTTTGLTYTADSVTTGDAMFIAANALTTGQALQFDIDLESSGGLQPGAVFIGIQNNNGTGFATNGVAINYTDGAAASTTVDYALSIENALSTNVTAGSDVDALLYLNNLDSAATGSTEVLNGILVASTTADFMIDAFDASEVNITNAFNAGANFITMGANRGGSDATAQTLRMFGSGTVFTLEDIAGNDLLTVTDNGTTGNVAVTGRFASANHAANQGLKLPTNAGVPAAVTGTAEGDIVWDSTNDAIYVYNGSAFVAGGISVDSLDFTEFQDTLDLDAALTLNQTTNTWSQTFTGTTTTGLTYTADSVTTGDAMFIAANALTTGQALQFDIDLESSGGLQPGAVFIGIQNNNGTGFATNGVAINYTDGAAASTTVDYALSIENALSTNVTAGSDVDALLYLNNLDSAATGSTEVLNGILVASTTADFMIDAFDASEVNITNAFNAGANFITMGANRGGSDATAQTLRMFGSGTVFTLEDIAGNDLLTVTDNGTTGNVAVTGRFASANHAANQGLKLPTNAGVPAAVTGTAEGDIVWDSTNDAIYVYNGSAFVAGGISVDSLDFTEFQDTLDLDAALTLNQTTNTWSQTFTGTTTTGLTYTADSVTTGDAMFIAANALTTGQALQFDIDLESSGGLQPGAVFIGIQNNNGTGFATNGVAINYTDGAAASTTVDYALSIENALSTNVTAGSDVDALLYLNNLDSAATGSTEVLNGILVASTTADFMIDAFDASEVNITNAFNAGANFITMGANRGGSDATAQTLRMFGSGTVFTLEDIAGNDLLTVTDNGTTGNVAVTGRFASANHAANQGLKLPTNAGVPAAVTGTAEGDIVWDSTNDAIYVYNGSAFVAGGISVDSLDFTEFQDTLDLDAALTLNQTTNTWSQTFTGTTTTGLTYTADSVTTGDAMFIAANALTTGQALQFDIDLESSGGLQPGAVFIGIQNNNGTGFATNGVAINYTDGAAASTTVDYALSIENALSTNVTAGSDVDALLYLNNLDSAATGSTEVLNGILVASTTADFMIDAFDASEVNITNAFNAGANFITMGANRGGSDATAQTLRMFGSGTVFTVEDIAGNDLMTITDNGTTGNVAVTGRLDIGDHAANVGLNIPTNTGVPADVTGSANGDLVYNNSNDTLYVREAGTWTAVGGGGGGTSIGGTVTSGTTGSLLFVGSGPVLSQDNTNLFWDDTNNFLGIGDVSPSARLDIVAPNITTIEGGGAADAMLRLRHDDSGTGGIGLEFGFGGAGSNHLGARIVADIVSGGGADLYFQTGSASAGTYSSKMTILKAGNVGVGDLTPASLFTVGSGDTFQVNSSGNIVKINNITYSWPGAQAVGSGYVLSNDSAGNLTWVTPSSITADSLDFSDFQDTLDLDAALTLNQTTNTWSQTFTGTSTNGFTYTADSVNTGNAFTVVAGGLDSGHALLVDVDQENTNTTNLGMIEFDITNNNPSNQTATGFLLDYTIGASVPAASNIDLMSIQSNVATSTVSDIASYLRIQNLDTSGTGSTIAADGLLVQSTTADFIVDAVDASDSELTNALNAGDNFIILGTTNRLFASGAVTTFEDTSGNDLLTITDNGTTGNVTMTGLVGIGDTTPDDLLNIHSAAAEAALAITSLGTNTDALIKFELADGTANFSMGVDDSDNDYFKLSTTALGTGDIMVVDPAGYIGIGTSPTSGYRLSVNSTDTTTSDNAAGSFAASSNHTSGTRNVTTGLEVSAGTQFSGSTDTTNVKGVVTNTTHGGSGTITNSYGIQAQTSSTSSGTVTNARAVFSRIYTASTATITNGASVYIAGNDTGAGGSITNSYGLYMESQTAGATLNYAIYSAGGQSYHSGNFGIGADTTPDFKLDVEVASATVAGFNRLTDDGIIIALQQDGTTEGDISVSGTTISYNAFTGSHYAWTDTAIARGYLVRMTGLNRSLHGNPESEILYGIAPTSIPNDPAVMGAYLSLQTPAIPADDNNPHLVMAVGNGDMWVAENGAGNLAPGDELISSSVTGHAMKDTGDYGVSHVVAKVAEAVDWSTVSESVGGVKHKKISVFFQSYDSRHSGKFFAFDEGDGGITTQSSRSLSLDQDLDLLTTDAYGFSVLGSGFGETFPSDQALTPGEIVMIDTATAGNVLRATAEAPAYLMAGVTADRAGFLAGPQDVGRYPVIASGKATVKVTTENGPIAIGDPIAVSLSTPGAGAKAVDKTYILGIALAPWAGEGTGEVTVYVKTGWWNGSTVEQSNTDTSGGIPSAITGPVDLAGQPMIGIGALEGLGALWRIDGDGTIAVVKAEVQEVTVVQKNEIATIDTVTVRSGEDYAQVHNPAVTPSTRVFLTPRGRMHGGWWVTDVTDGLFVIKLENPALEDVQFDYWLVQVRDERAPEAPEPPPTTTTEPEPTPEPVVGPDLVVEEPTVEVIPTQETAQETPSP